MDGNLSFMYDSFLNSLEKRITLINVTMTISNEEYHEDIERLGSEKSQSLVARIKQAVRCYKKVADKNKVVISNGVHMLLI